MVESIGVMGRFYMPKTKRNHYIPKAYLRHFASPNDPEKVHVFDKESERWMLTNVVNAGVWNDFYSDEDEKRLSDEIEFPANSALAKLRGGQCIDADERLKVALYLESMIKRVPSTRRAYLEGAPRAWARLREDTEEVSSKLGTSPQVIQIAIDRLEEEQFREPFSMTSEIAQHQWSTQKIIDALLGMDWAVLVARGLDIFVTGDNPAFFDWQDRLNTPKSEVVFPLSPSAVLHVGGPKPKDGSINHIVAASAQVKGINRRMILGAERFVYSNRELPWIKDVIRNPVRQWKRILK